MFTKHSKFNKHQISKPIVIIPFVRSKIPPHTPDIVIGSRVSLLLAHSPFVDIRKLGIRPAQLLCHGLVVGVITKLDQSEYQLLFVPSAVVRVSPLRGYIVLLGCG